MRAKPVIYSVSLTSVLCFTASAFATEPATRPSTAAMQQRIDQLENRIQTLQQRQAQSQADVSAAIQQVLTDADKHSQLLSASSAAMTGYDPDTGFVIRSMDQDFSLHIGGLFQFREVANYRSEVPAGGSGVASGTGYNWNEGFEISRMRLTLDGNAYSPLFTYYLQFDADQGTPFTLLDAYVMWRVSAQSPLALKAGQFKDPLFHERNLLPGNQLAVDRSILDALIGGGQTNRVQGAEVVYDENNLRGVAAFHDGYNTGNTPFFDSGGLGATTGAGGGVTPPQWGATVRAEYMLIGDRTAEFNPFSEYDQFTSLGAKKDVLIVGGGVDYTESSRDKVVFHTVDAQYNSPSGLSAYIAYLASYRDLGIDKGVRAGSYYDSGAMIQAGYMIGKNFEPFARYDYTHLDGQADPGIVQDNIHELTLGLNYYLHGQAAKFTIDASYLPNGCPTDITNLGVLKDDGHVEWVFRAQFQLQI